jgi:ribonuclease HI
MNTKLIAATDGSHCKGKFGWSFVVTTENGEVLSTCYGANLVDPRWAHAWNVAAECTAVIELLKSLEPSVELTILHDYEGLGKWARGEWKANKPCSIGYIVELKKLARKVTFKWVKGHDGHVLNEQVDTLAGKALREQPKVPVFKGNDES